MMKEPGTRARTRFPVTFEHKEIAKTATLKFEENNMLMVAPVANATEKQIKFRNSWLSAKVK